MKKILIIIIITFLCVILVGCSQSNLSDEAKAIGKSAVDTANQYLNGSVAMDEACGMMGIYRDSLDALPEPEGESESISLLALKNYVLSLKIDLNYLMGVPSESKIKGSIKSIEELI